MHSRRIIYIRSLLGQAQRGFTLTELAIVLGIVGILISAIWIAADNVYESYRTKKAVEEVLQITAGVRSIYSKGTIDSTFATSAIGDLTPALVNAGNVFVPDSLVTPCPNPGYSSPCPIHPWNGQILVTSDAGVSGSPITTRAFEVTFWNLSPSQCSELLARVVSAAAINKLTFFNTSAGPAAGVTVTSTTGPNDAIKICGTGFVTMQFKL